MYLYAGYEATDLGNEPANEKQFVGPEPVGNVVEPDCMKARIAKEHLKSVAGCRVTIEYRRDVLFHAGNHMASFLLSGNRCVYCQTRTCLADPG
jgi:hypothetical protein